jgi:hypothetical protein
MCVGIRGLREKDFPLNVHTVKATDGIRSRRTEIMSIQRKCDHCEKEQTNENYVPDIDINISGICEVTVQLCEDCIEKLKTTLQTFLNQMEDREWYEHLQSAGTAKTTIQSISIFFQTHANCGY